MYRLLTVLAIASGIVLCNGEVVLNKGQPRDVRTTEWPSTTEDYWTTTEWPSTTQDYWTTWPTTPDDGSTTAEESTTTEEWTTMTEESTTTEEWTTTEESTTTEDWTTTEESTTPETTTWNPPSTTTSRPSTTSGPGGPVDWYNCTGKPDGNYLHPCTCTRYIFCVGQKHAYEMLCSTNIELWFDRAANMCLNPNDTVCQTEPPCPWKGF